MTDYVPSCIIQEINLVCLNSIIGCDTCAICKNSIQVPSIEYQANPVKTHENGLIIATGCCGHSYHLDCIQRWNKNRSTCPLCNHEWNIEKSNKLELGLIQIS